MRFFKPSSPHEISAQTPFPRVWGWLLFFGALAWGLANLQWGRSVSWDEFEFLKATDWIRRGAVPYRDFYEHHTPLSWYLMAPFEALSHGPGVRPVLFLRWVQVPVWGVGCWLIWGWMKADEDPLWVRLSAMTALLASPFFILPALEYRVDTLGTVLAIIGLDQLKSGGNRSHMIAGAALALSALANLRFGPFAVAVALIACCLDMEKGKWGFRASWLFSLIAGALAAILPWLAYLLATHSLWDMWHWCVTQTAAASNAMIPQRAMFYWLSSPFLNWDIAGITLEVGLILGAAFIVTRLRRPGFLHLLLIAQIINLAFVAVMKVEYLYHFELTLCLAVPFLAVALSSFARRMSRPQVVLKSFTLVLSLALAIDAMNLIVRNDHDSLRFQDATLRSASKLLKPGDKVLDGCGYLPQATPAYRFWFLPLLVRDLSLSGKLESYTPAAFAKDPPALVIADIRLGNWSSEWPEIGRNLITHYLPTLPNLWVPGLSYPFATSRRAWTWSVPKTAKYRLVCGPGLSAHPWFSAPFVIVSTQTQMTAAYTIHPDTFDNHGSEELSWELNGRPVQLVGGYLDLRRGDQLAAHYSGQDQLGMMLVPEGTGPLFLGADFGVNLDNIHFNGYYRPL